MSYDDQLSGGATGQPDARMLAASELAALTAGLDDELVTIAVMSMVDGLTQQEIAENLGLSRRTIVKRLKSFKKATGDRWREMEGGSQ